MKTTLGAAVAVALAAAITSPSALSQTPPPSAAPQAAPAVSKAAPAASKVFTQEQLDQMLASIALYPDALLSQVLMASTYPLEIVEADRWVKAHASLKGEALQDALKGQPWDESTKSLTAFPEVLDRMSKDLTWTQQLGDAFLGQQQVVMETVQKLRQKAQAAGNLQSNEQQKVAVQNTYIVIEPANPQVVYVPTYNPVVVYGTWWWPAYPPYYPPYWVHPGAPFVRGVFWGAGIAAGAALWGGFNWNNHDVNINVNRYNNFNRTNISNSNWTHNAAHRNGVPYRDNGARQKYGAQDLQATQAREQFRGRDTAQAAQGLSDRGAGAANRANAGGASAGTLDRGNAGANRAAQSGTSGNRAAPNDLSGNRAAQDSMSGSRASDRGGGFNVGNGAQTRDYSNRGASSMGNRSGASAAPRAAGGARAGAAGGAGGGGRGGGGGRR